MRIETEDDLQGMRAAGRVVRLALEAMRIAVEPGINTAQLDALGARVFTQHGAKSAPQLVYDFPGINCISVNDEIVHGIPSQKRVLAQGDLVKLDVTAELNGYMADAAVTVAVGRVSARARKLIDCAEAAFERALREVRPGKRVLDIGRAVEQEVVRQGFSVVRVLTGHSIGRTIHEDPMVPNWADPAALEWLTDGLVITVEPIITMGHGACYEADDGWTILTQDGSLAAHFEQTLVVTKDGPMLLTAA
ncbi:MAG: type I methionyl aminopeptidase [Candidatus Eisenbacteria bacterium]